MPFKTKTLKKKFSRKRKEEEPDVLKGMVAGLAGGLAGSLAMNLFHASYESLTQRRDERYRQSWKHLGQAPSPMHIQMSSHPSAEETFFDQEFLEEMEERPPYREKDTTAPPPLSRDQFDESAPVKAASAVSEKVLGHELSRREKEVAGPMVHYLFGSTLGLFYGIGSEFMPWMSFGGGAPFGATVMVATEEITSPALRFSQPPRLHEKTTHLYSLLSHIIYGITCDLVRKQVRRMLR